MGPKEARFSWTCFLLRSQLARHVAMVCGRLFLSFQLDTVALSVPIVLVAPQNRKLYPWVPRVGDVRKREEGCRKVELYVLLSACHGGNVAETIVTFHDVTDFDALASAVGMQLLNPKARIVRRRLLDDSLRDFLALHRELFPTISMADVELSAVHRLIVVDVRKRSRLQHIAPLLAAQSRNKSELFVEIVDHHPASDDDLTGNKEIIAPVGAATSLVVEQLQLSGITPDPMTATLFALGIYSDTGSLRYANTSHRDAAALAWVLAHGAQLSVVNQYLRTKFSPWQRALLLQMLSQVELQVVHGITFAWVEIDVQHQSENVADVVSEWSDLQEAHVSIALFRWKRSAVVVGRSKTKALSMGRLFSSLGGGGHDGAGSWRMKGHMSANWRELLLNVIEQLFVSPQLVVEIMTSPVHVVPPEMPIYQLAHSLECWRHTGVPVMRDQKIIGIISRTNIEKAYRAHQEQLPVSSCMSHHVLTTTPETTIEHVFQIMTEKNVGRLPVIRAGILIGMITRTDILRVLYPSSDNLTKSSES
jgi:tRNA nucleotidyltransferase (CCA-adding enzyme)